MEFCYRPTLSLFNSIFHPLKVIIKQKSQNKTCRYFSGLKEKHSFNSILSNRFFVILLRKSTVDNTVNKCHF